MKVKTRINKEAYQTYLIDSDEQLAGYLHNMAVRYIKEVK